MNELQSECHLHLYGCLPKEALFRLGAERRSLHPTRFQWFLSEYKKITGVTLDPENWWGKNGNFETFAHEALFTSAAPFEIFQAKFNLLIALFPAVPEDLTLASAVFEQHALEGGYKEYRTFLPMALSQVDRTKYLRQMIEAAQSYSSASYQPRLAFSLPRQNTAAQDSYLFLSHFLDTHPHLAQWVTGIDFCANEHGHHPAAKKDFFQQVRNDNLTRKQPLSILYHVGEMWQDIAIHSAARWCVEAAQIGAHRLGHALALGMNCHSLLGQVIKESPAETEDTFRWLRQYRDILHVFGFTSGDYAWFARRAELSIKEGQTHWFYDQDLVNQTTHFQNAALAMVQGLGPIVESCPTSNMRIGGLTCESHHPLRRFADHGLNFVIATDDPGIFDIDLRTEENFATAILGLSSDQLRESNRRTESIFTNLGEPLGPRGHS
jgi:Adenosine deaminase